MSIRHIYPTVLYTASEIEDLLHGFVSLDMLRQHGLRAMPGRGYWGKAVIASIDRLCEDTLSQPRGVSSRKETNDAFFEKQGETDPHDRLVRSRTVGKHMEGPGTRESDRTAIHSLAGESGQVESQRDKLRRLAKAGEVSGHEPGGSNRAGCRDSLRQPVRPRSSKT
ncbi:MAG: hypothetical protein HDKAJFGB_02286 [Anaerolineae bacterium]|nr:hypothetical protein [Anaerolineae bacterium]